MIRDVKDRYRVRSAGRRNEDRAIRRQLDRFKALSLMGKAITSEIRLNPLFLLINQKTNEIMNVERSSVFLHDEKTDELWSFVATGMAENEIRIPSHQGIAGWVFRNRAPLRINDVYNDQRFLAEVDTRSGFTTRQILCIPLINRKNKCIGVIQALNPETGEFSREDEGFLEAIGDHVAIALENASLFHEVKTYSEKLKNALVLNESLERLKRHLTKFVPRSVVDMAEKRPDTLDQGKVPMDVSVLFVDVEGFSRLTETYEQELVNHMIETHFSAYLNCVYTHGGEVNETSGDGVMVIFRADADEDHAFSAVKAGLEIISENRRLNREFGYPWGDVGLHLGISSGQGHVGTTRMKSAVGERWTYTASGLVTVLAARIGAQSSASKLYVGDETHDRLKGRCHSAYVGQRELKNVSRSMEIFRVTAIKERVDMDKASVA
ncbi:MAG: GAF domain-containing protein [Desulfobacterales bacterium]|nr:GAF domain-containing protein [Desulfobacterales bacterium]